MRTTLVLLVAVSSCVFAPYGSMTRAQNTGPAPTIAWGGMIVGNASGTPMQGAPYSATITVKSVRTLADGGQIAQTSVGATARDSQGRTREEPPVPSVPANVPHLVFIQDPVTHKAYALNLTNKTAQKMPSAESIPGGDDKHAAISVMQAGGAVIGGATTSTSVLPSTFAVQDIQDTSGQTATEDLGSQTIEGLVVTGVRTMRTIPAGQFGNTEAIKIVTEVWTSPDLKTIVYSKRSDPLTGDSSFKLSNISRAEPDPSLFSVPADFKIVDNPTITFRQPNTQN